MPYPQPKDNFNDELYLALEKSAKTVYGQNTKILLGISPASSESEILSRHGILTYGIGPKIFSSVKGEKENQTGGPHQADEFIEEDSFKEQFNLTFFTLKYLLEQ